MKQAIKVKDNSKEKKQRKTKALTIVKSKSNNVIQQAQAAEIMTTNPEALIMMAIKNNAGMDTLERLLTMKERLEKEVAAKAFREAMSGFQAECPIIIKSAGVDYTSRKGSQVKYQYAPFDVIVSQVRDPLSKNGLSYSFTTEQTEKSVTAICHAHHLNGHTESTSFTVPIDLEGYMNVAQQVATALTYAKRYAFCNAFGILTSDEDTDANKPDPGANKQAEEAAEQKKAEDKEQAEYLKNLPQNIKDGFTLLGYADKNDKGRAAYLFCKGHKFNNELIIKHLNLIADKK
jgi:hypothetical protein